MVVPHAQRSIKILSLMEQELDRW